MAFTISLAILAVLCLLLWKRWARFRLLNRMGLKTADRPNFVAGNLMEIHKSGLITQLMRWTQKHGSIYGYYEGSTPIVVVADAKTARQVLVNSFGACHARKTYPLQEDPDTAPDTNVFLARGARWKRLRCITNPAFSVNNLKKVFPKASSHVATLMEKLRSMEGTPIDIHDIYHRFTLDTFFDIAFGFSMNALDNPNNSYLQGLRRLIRFDIKDLPIIMILDVICAELNKLWIAIAKLFHLQNVMKDYLSAITNRLNDVIETRRKITAAERPQDILQLLLDAEVPQDVETLMENTQCESKQMQSQHAHVMDKIVNFGLKKLTIEEVKSSSTLFLLAGFETTANALAFFTQQISRHPRIQQKLLEEIHRTFADEEEISWDKLQSMRYLDLAIKETLRMFPIAAPLTNRLCVEDVVVGNAVIPSGTPIQVDIFSIHYDPKVWGPVSPYEFYPERFESENSSEMLSHWMPYGLGPRQCIGMRFAQIEMKACIVNLLRRFEICPPNSSDAKSLNEVPSKAVLDVRSMIENRDPLVNPIAGIHQGPTLSPAGGVHVLLVERVTCTDLNDAATSPLRSAFVPDRDPNAMWRKTGSRNM